MSGFFLRVGQRRFIEGTRPFIMLDEIRFRAVVIGDLCILDSFQQGKKSQKVDKRGPKVGEWGPKVEKMGPKVVEGRGEVAGKRKHDDT